MNYPRKQAILNALHVFIRQRPGMDPRNYRDAASYNAERRAVLRDLHDADQLLRALEQCDAITADMILAEAGSGGRLTIVSIRDVVGSQENTVGYRVEYCTGQYFPTEYRKAVARLAASVLWAYVREHGMPEPSVRPHTQERVYVMEGAGWVSAGDWLRAHFKRQFGPRIASRYFN